MDRRTKKQVNTQTTKKVSSPISDVRRKRRKQVSRGQNEDDVKEEMEEEKNV